MTSSKELQEVFFQDPRWKDVEEMLLKHVEPLIDMSTIDLTQPAEHVKAEVIGRTLAYNSLVEFLNSTKVLTNRPLSTVTNPFKWLLNRH